MSQLSIISKRAKLGLVDGAQKLKWVKTSSRSLSLEMVGVGWCYCSFKGMGFPTEEIRAEIAASREVSPHELLGEERNWSLARNQLRQEGCGKNAAERFGLEECELTVGHAPQALGRGD